MKRKQLSVENQKGSKSTKMDRVGFEPNESLVVSSGSNVKSSLTQHFNYEISDQKAKSNLIKGAAREALEVQHADFQCRSISRNCNTSS